MLMNKYLFLIVCRPGKPFTLFTCSTQIGKFQNSETCTFLFENETCLYSWTNQ